MTVQRTDYREVLIDWGHCQQIVFLYLRLIYNLTHRGMFTSKVRTDDSAVAGYYRSRILAPRYHAGREPHQVIQPTTSEGLAQGPYVAAMVGFEPAPFRTEPPQVRFF